MHHSKFYFFRLDAWPRFGHEASGGQPSVVEQRDQDALPAAAKDTDQTQARSLTLTGGQQQGGWQRQQRADRDRVLGFSVRAQGSPTAHALHTPLPQVQESMQTPTLTSEEQLELFSAFLDRA